MQIKKSILKILYVLIFFILIVGCKRTDKVSNNSSKPINKDIITNSTHSKTIVENKSVYQNEKTDKLLRLFVTVRKASNKKKNFIFSDLLTLNEQTDLYEPEVDVLFQEGTNTGPSMGYYAFGMNKPNATMSLRGHASRNATQKSFKISLYDNVERWMGCRNINLNKHPTDISRVRNKLSFDYFKIIPDMVSLKTQFVQVYIKDLSGKIVSNQFENFGLFTQIEDPGKRYLKTHGLDSSGHLYKAENFYFQSNTSAIKTKKDSNYNKKEFEKILEIKGSEDHQKLIRMLEDVNNYNMNINDIISTHFSRENYLTWLAINLITGNFDTESQNFMLYSPLNSDTWFFIPWDYDGGWGFENQVTEELQIGMWRKGVSLYWNCVLHKRFMKDPANLKDISNKIEEISKIITPKKTKELLDSYIGVLNDSFSQLPNSESTNNFKKDFSIEYEKIPSTSENNKEVFYKNLEKPMPIFLSDAIFIRKGEVLFQWDVSYDLQGDDLTYDFELSLTPDFIKPLTSKKGLYVTSTTVSNLLPGRYFWRVIIKDIKGNEQYPFDEMSVNSTTYFGLKDFWYE